MPKAKYTAVTPNDMKIKVSEVGLCSNLVIDGHLMENNIKSIGKDPSWVLKRLNNMGYSDISQLLLVICDNKEQFTVYTKNIDKDIKIFD